MKLIILKLGGSILTLKHRNIPIFRTRIVHRIIKEIKRAQTENNFKLILIHGTGSFGHPVAKFYNLNKGLLFDSTGMGLSKSKRLGYLLNGLIWQVLEQNNLPGITIPPYSIITSINGRISSMNLRPIKTTLDINRIPILFGDEVIDLKKGYSVCSSDHISAYLAHKLKPDLLLFASDVDGVYDQNPKVNPEADKFSNIELKNINQLQSQIKPYNLSDISGEMAGKLRSLCDFTFSSRTRIRLFSGLTPNQVYKALNNQPVGTRISF